jgi:hypothetical protein
MTEDKIYQQIEKDIDQLTSQLGLELNTQIDAMLVEYQSTEEREKYPSLDDEGYTRHIRENITLVWMLRRMALAEVIQKYNNEQQAKIVVILEQIRAHVFKLPSQPLESVKVEETIDEKAKEASDYFYHYTTKGEEREV